MSAKGISEASGKRLLNQFLTTAAKCKFASVSESSDFGQVLADHPWLQTEVGARVCKRERLTTSLLPLLSSCENAVTETGREAGSAHQEEREAWTDPREFRL